MLLVTHMGNSTLVIVSLDKNGIVADAKGHQIGTGKSGMQRIFPSKAHPGELKLLDHARGPITLESKHIMKLRHFNESNYELFQASEFPIYVSPSSTNNPFYPILLKNSKILKIDPLTKLTEEIDISPNHEIFPIGLILGPNGAWFTLLGNKKLRY